MFPVDANYDLKIKLLISVYRIYIWLDCDSINLENGFNKHINVKINVLTNTKPTMKQQIFSHHLDRNVTQSVNS